MATLTNNTPRKDFDFEAYNAVMKGANAGLKLFLVQQMLSDIATTAFRYRNPLAQQLINLADETESLRTEWKAISAKSQRQTPEGKPAQVTDKPVFDSAIAEVTIY
jgi:hypothetical protein